LGPARTDLDRAAALDPDCFWIRAWRGELLAHQGLLAPGLADLDRALALFPDFAQARVWKGQVQLALGRARPALRQFRAALERDPQNVWAMIGSAACLEKNRRTAEAAELLERARALAPGLFAAAARG
jgi:tetratricopeptide (TPR) repeat protein